MSELFEIIATVLFVILFVTVGLLLIVLPRQENVPATTGERIRQETGEAGLEDWERESLATDC